jgi:hypothetical protein
MSHPKVQFEIEYSQLMLNHKAVIDIARSIQVKSVEIDYTNRYVTFTYVDNSTMGVSYEVSSQD